MPRNRNDPPTDPPAQPPGGFLVRATSCASCIYRADSPLDIRKLEADVADPHFPGAFRTHRICHYEHATGACCRGFWIRHADAFPAGQLAQRLGMVVETDSRALGAGRPPD